MKVKKHNKRILGLFLIIVSAIFTYCFLVNPVYAKDEEKKKKTDFDSCKKQQEYDFAGKYGITMKYEPPSSRDGDGIFKVSMNLDPALKAEKKNFSFTVSEIFVTDGVRTIKNAEGKDVEVNITYKNKIDSEDKDSGVHINVYNDVKSSDQLASFYGLTSKTLSDGGSIAFNSKRHFISQNNGLADTHELQYFVVLKPNFEDSALVNECGKGVEFVAVAQYLWIGDPSSGTDTSTVTMAPAPVSQTYIECDNYANKFTDKNSFEYMYCHTRQLALDSGVQVTTFSNDTPNYSAKYPDQTEKFYCNAFDVTSTRKIKDGDYYSNTSYLLGTIVYTIPAGHYTYNYGGRVPTVDENGTTKYGPGAYIDKEDVSCKIQCDEVVVIEYGPPVASKAGLCFEYKVQVTSRVNCKTIENPKPPRSSLTYCTPSPGCNHGNGFVDIGAGPTEEFDTCVSKCDGGKYTSKCSRQCYNEVYGNNTAVKNTNAPYGEFDVVATALYGNNTETRDYTQNGVGYYRCTGSENSAYRPIVWKPASHLGRWYVEAGINTSHACLKTEAEGGGISSVCGCSAVCRWNGCNCKKNYLNPGEAKVDYEANVKEYNKMVAKCDAFSKCSTETATFSIETDYTYGEGEVRTIYFPYTNENNPNSSNRIKYSNESSTSSVTCDGSNANSSILYHSEGCYECGKTDVKNTRFYQTEWGFPGSWIHNKTGEVSYTPQQTGWIGYEKTFCLPLDSNDVNDKWWTFYYVERYKNDSRFSSNSEDFNLGMCPGEDFSNVTFTKEDEKQLNYNIRAKARKYGQFGWNIDINCFYALNQYCLSEDAAKPANPGDDSVRIRSVDLANVFPAEDGEMLTTQYTTGRTPGFNWSKYAINIQSGKYVIEPSDYLFHGVQERGYSVYSEDNLDYEIILTRDKIAKLRDKKVNYASFEGDVDESGTVSSYKSPLFRGNDALFKDDDGGNKLPNTSVLGCNNIRNNKSNECEYFGGGVN